MPLVRSDRPEFQTGSILSISSTSAATASAAPAATGAAFSDKVGGPQIPGVATSMWPTEVYVNEAHLTRHTHFPRAALTWLPTLFLSVSSRALRCLCRTQSSIKQCSRSCRTAKVQKRHVSEFHGRKESAQMEWNPGLGGQLVQRC